jgi:regulatory factor X
MDTSATQDDGLASGHQPGLSFSDFAGAGSTFDVSSFTSQELGINSSDPPASEADNEQEPVKLESEQQQQQGV